jgi:RHS repeat-associated protein
MTRLGTLLALAVLGTRPLAAQDATEYYHVDGVGSVRAVSDPSGALLERHDYLPFGEEWCPGSPGAVCGTVAAGQPRRFTGQQRDTETGLDAFGARYYAAHVARFSSVDPVFAWRSSLFDPERWNRYAYARNNPLRFADPDGREVMIIIQRDTYTANSVTGTVWVGSTLTRDSWNGFTLENAKAGQNHDKPPIPWGTYNAHVRTDHNPDRVELEDVPGYSHIQIHNGNEPADAKGCFLAGATRGTDVVNSSVAAMGKIKEVIAADGSGTITVVVFGAPTATPATAPGSPAATAVAAPANPVQPPH